MVLTDASLTVVLIGDWNRWYIQPDWIAEEVYCRKEIEIGIIRQGTDFSVTYRCDNIAIVPSQRQMTFIACDMENTTIDKLVSCVNCFLKKAITPKLEAYGLNCEFIEEDSSHFADVLDAMSDNASIIKNGYEILSTKISRSLSKDGRNLNFEVSQDGKMTIMRFNEHHDTPMKEMPVMTVEMVDAFLSSSKNLLIALGYDIEDIRC